MPLLPVLMCAKITLFQGGIPDDRFLDHIADIIDEELSTKGHKVEQIHLSALSIAPCKGCLDCWVLTPGKCVIDDDGRKTTNLYLTSDIVILLSRINFGGYNSVMKCAIDRLIPLALPFFRQYQGETHHPLRYKTYPSVIAIGVLEKQDNHSTHIFHRLVHRNALNFCPPKTAICVIVENEDKYKEKLRNCLSNINGDGTL